MKQKSKKSFQNSRRPGMLSVLLALAVMMGLVFLTPSAKVKADNPLEVMIGSNANAVNVYSTEPTYWKDNGSNSGIVATTADATGDDAWVVAFDPANGGTPILRLRNFTYIGDGNYASYDSQTSGAITSRIPNLIIEFEGENYIRSTGGASYYKHAFRGEGTNMTFTGADDATLTLVAGPGSTPYTNALNVAEFYLFGGHLICDGTFYNTVYNGMWTTKGPAMVYRGTLEAKGSKTIWGDGSQIGLGTVTTDEAWHKVITGNTNARIVVFRVVNGSWDDETKANVLVPIFAAEGQPLKLGEDMIPAVGTKPDEGYEAGSWDVVPDTDTEITRFVTYTYTYTEKQKESVVNVFNDIPEGAWFVKAVQYVYDNGIMAGTGVAFKPNDPVTREQFTQVLYNHSGKPEVNIENKFPDVKPDKWYTNAVLWANEKGIAAGNGDGTFGVTKNITREQLALMLYKYADLLGCELQEGDGSYAEYADADKISGWAEDAMDWAVTNGIMSGKGDKNAPVSERRLDPKGKATRAECAQMIMKLFQNGGEA